jgi:hypothetical protein
MKLHIISDGSIEGTKVLTPNGEQLEGVQWLQLFVTKDKECNEVILSLIGSSFELELEDGSR